MSFDTDAPPTPQDAPGPQDSPGLGSEIGGVAASAIAGAAKGGAYGAAAGAAKQVAMSALRDPRKRRRWGIAIGLLVLLQVFPLTMLGLAGASAVVGGTHTNPSVPGTAAVTAGLTRQNLDIAIDVGNRYGVSWEVLASLVWNQAQGGITSAPTTGGGGPSTSTGPLAADWRLPLVGDYDVTSSFGWRIHPIYGDSRLHTGVDLVMKPGPGPVVAAASGVVVSAGMSGNSGNTVRVDHGGGIQTAYKHLASFATGVIPGATVSAGQVLGVEGSTGDSTGAHLHFEVADDGTPIDPVPFMAQHGVTIADGGSGAVGSGTLPDGAVGTYGTGVGPLRINAGSEPANATDLRASLEWAAQSMRTRMDYRTDISAGMRVGDDGPAIDAADPAARVARAQYLAGLGGLPLAGMNPATAGRVYDQALAWRLGKSYSASGSAYGVTCDTSAFGVVSTADLNGNPVTVSADEMRNVAVMVTVAKQAGLSERAMVIAAMAMAQESGFRNLASKAIPESLSFPHDDVAPGDHRSVGLFQQQTEMGWGTLAQIMDPVHAAQAFFGISDSLNPGLTDLTAAGWDIESAPMGPLIQAVQHSGRPDAYDKWEPVARAVVGAALGVSCASSFATLADASAGAVTIVNAARAWLGTAYSYGGGNLVGPTLGIAQGANTVGFDCSGLTRYAYNKAGLSLPRTADGQYQFALGAGKINTDPNMIAIGELVFFGTPDHIHHIGIYIGGGQILHAPHTGDVVKISNMTTDREADFVASSTFLG